MVTLGTVVGLSVLVAVNTALAAVCTRFFRLRLHTRWGTALFVTAFVPVVLTVSLLIVGQLPVFRGIDRDTVLLVGILLPLSLGIVIDLFWMPHPDEVDLVPREES